ncbi:MAG: hypothetical protein AAF702_39050 [Chloroflexota bacterium]
MRNKQLVTLSIAFSALLIALTSFIFFQNRSIQAQTAPNCAPGYLIDETFSTNARWQMCWEHRSNEGIVLTEITYITPGGTVRQVLEEAGLAQIHTPYDDNSARYHYVTDYGLGDANMLALTGSECGGTLLSHNGKQLLCHQIEERGYVYKYYNTKKQGSLLSLYSISQIAEQAFIVRWNFYDDGTIEPMIGNTGQLRHMSTNSNYGWPLDNAGRIGVGFTHNYYWRLNFNIGDNGANERVEELNFNPASSNTRKQIAKSTLSSESSRSVNPALKRSWRIIDGTITNGDGHAVSYHLEPLQAGHRYVGDSSEPWTNNDIYFTRFNACERFVSHNPPTGGCGNKVTDFVNGQNINGANVVVWYGISYHHLPRDEDEAFMLTHMDGFQLIPRDWTSTNPLSN